MKKEEIIKENKKFVTLYKRGYFKAGKAVVIYFKKNGTDKNKIGITSSKKIGNAVKRNRARRIIRAAYDACRNEFPKGYDIIIVAREGAVTAKSYHIASFFRKTAIPFMNNPTRRNNNGK